MVQFGSNCVIEKERWSRSAVAKMPSIHAPRRGEERVYVIYHPYNNDTSVVPITGISSTHLPRLLSVRHLVEKEVI